MKDFIKKIKGPLILDSCCGTGMSSRLLAKEFPDHAVVGVDKSSARLSRAEPFELANCLLLQANVIDLWPLILRDNLPVARHYLYFPNPWPKISQVARRFHADPVFNVMAALAPFFELRTNWEIYAQECSIAFETLGYQPKISVESDYSPRTLFEKKYLETACKIYISTNHQADTKASLTTAY